MKTTIFPLAAMLLLYSACSPVTVSYDYDKNADFKKYKTYSYADHVGELKVNQLDKDRITNAIDNEMTTRGYTKSSNPDLLVDLHTKTQQEQSATATTMGSGMYGPWGYGFGGGFTTTNIDVNNYTDGTLFINVIDKQTEKIVWQGRGTKTLSENISPEKKEANINAAVASIFGKYPIQKGK